MSRLTKTAPKPVKKKVATPKIKQGVVIRRILKKLGYSIDESLSSDFVNYSLETDNKDSESFASISFDIQSLEHCCGVVEAGNLSIDPYNMNIEELTTDQKTAVDLLVALAFLDARDEHIAKHIIYGATPPMARPLIFCSNGEDDCIVFERVATKYLKGYYKLVSTTRNPGSHNIIKTYISQY